MEARSEKGNMHAISMLRDTGTEARSEKGNMHAMSMLAFRTGIFRTLEAFFVAVFRV